MEDYANYRTINVVKNAGEKNWCLSAQMIKPIKQVTVKLNDNKAYQYASRYNAEETDVAIIGNSYVYETGGYVSRERTTGCMGIISNVKEKLVIRKSDAVELDFVFTQNVSKKTITDCAKYLNTSGNEKTLQFGKEIDTIYPITYLIRKILAASSIIAFSELSTPATIKKAKGYIQTPQIIDAEMSELRMACPELVDIDLTSIHTDVDGKDEEEIKNMNLSYISAGILNGFKRKEEIEECVNDYVNKYSYVGAISIMVRGSFLNLLNAFLSAEPPIKEFSNEIQTIIKKFENSCVVQPLKEYMSR